ncbi:MAG: DUF393 domain-containing protein [Verrucomicrobia bacterium]|nr:DUF393 domain-containing protein [Verrucomicrobiota bacterium]
MGGTFFYDGDCGLCTGAVDFLRRRDREKRLKFLALQSPEAAALLPLELTQDLKTAVFLSAKDSAKRHLRSDAVLHALIEIGGFWRLFARVLAVAPKALRDWCYERVAANRHHCRWKKTD